MDSQRVGAVTLAVLAACSHLRAAEVSSAGAAPDAELGGDPSSLPGIVVVGSTPLVGADVNRDQVPQSTRVLGPGDINRTGIPTLTGAILDNVSSATVSDTEGNAFQPDILFRGFSASPVAGTPEGIAVYVNGARFNDAFGDTVNWDLIPPAAIDAVNLEAANPLFGLNALGGSVNIRLKNGFTHQTGTVTLYGGSYGRESGIFEYGQQHGDFAVYAVGDATHDDGFRRTSTSDLYRLTEHDYLASHANYLVAGASFDGSHSVFAGVQELGGFDPYTRDFVDPGVVQDQPGEGVNPVRVRSVTRFYGVFVTDLFTLTPGVDVNVAGRFNTAQIILSDELGGPVNGRHTFDRVNPSAGLTYSAAPWLQLYGNYSQTTRAPTPQELSCASAAAPCSLLNFFVGDPNLTQVVARTAEIGLRGRLGDAERGQLSWNVDAYHTQNTDDIIYETTIDNPNLAFYTNAGRTLRRGVEADLRYDTSRLHFKVRYALTDATFRTPLLLNSGSNPVADANGQEHVVPGDRLPGIPRHRVTLVLDCTVAGGFSVGASAVTQSGARRFGDEANLTAPLGGYTVVDLNAAFRAGERLTLFAVINNALDKRYSTYGSFGPVSDVSWPNVPGGVTDTRTASPGTPVTVYGGARLTF